MSKVAVIAIGGNSLIRDKNHKTVKDQFGAARETCRYIAQMINKGWNVVITHGNGPQVGFILRRSELSACELHSVPMDSAGADTQGAIGYMIQQSLYNEFQKSDIDKQAVTVVTQVLVDSKDPSFQNPSKPIGSFMDKKTALEFKEKENWFVGEDSGRGWRRMVASPKPKSIIEVEAIKNLIAGGFVVIAVGGGGIPVFVDEGNENELTGTAAVIDKDLASSLLAQHLSADMFLISTDIDSVKLNYGKEDEEIISNMTVDEAEGYLSAGEFKPGSMKPKVEAALGFLKKGGSEVIITSPENIGKALVGQAGTRISK